jgi:hypothetical protein
MPTKGKLGILMLILASVAWVSIIVVLGAERKNVFLTVVEERGSKKMFRLHNKTKRILHVEVIAIVWSSSPEEFTDGVTRTSRVDPGASLLIKADTAQLSPGNRLMVAYRFPPSRLEERIRAIGASLRLCSRYPSPKKQMFAFYPQQ